MADNKRVPNLVIENARIMWRNFAGEERRFNEAGDRNFVIFLENDVAEALARDGWNIKTLAPRDPEDNPQPFLKVSVNFKGPRPPRLVMITSRGRTDVPEEMAGVMDWAMIKNVDLIVRPYQWEVNGNSGIKAYLQSLYMTIEEDALELKYAEVPELTPLDATPLQIEAGSPEIIEGVLIEDDENF